MQVLSFNNNFWDKWGWKV